ncbi:MAG: toxin-antitoxin system TumE family protein [Geminicoccaceae bacterium]
MKARLLFYERRLFDDGAIMEMKIWRVPKSVPPTTHGLKYSLFYGYPGRRLVGYDNERVKGDHKHLDHRELPYTFVSVEQLVADFLADVRRMRGSL